LLMNSKEVSQKVTDAFDNKTIKRCFAPIEALINWKKTHTKMLWRWLCSYQACKSWRDEINSRTVRG
jgi:hypothetical protein